MHSVESSYLEIIKAIGEFGDARGEKPPAGVKADQTPLVTCEVLLLLLKLLPFQNRRLVSAVQQHLKGINSQVTIFS